MRNQNLNLGNQVSHEITVKNNRPHLQAPNANEDGLGGLHPVEAVQGYAASYVRGTT